MSLQDVSPVKQEVVMMVEGKKEEEEGEGKRKRRKTTTKNYSPRRNLFRRGQKIHHLVPLHFFLKVTEKNRLEGSFGSSWYTSSGGLEFGMVAMSRFKDRIR